MKRTEKKENPPQFALATEIDRAIDLSCRACDACGAGAGCWAWIPGGGLHYAPFSTPNLQLNFPSDPPIPINKPDRSGLFIGETIRETKTRVCSLERRPPRASGARGGLPALGGRLPPPEPPDYFFDVLLCLDHKSLSSGPEEVFLGPFVRGQAYLSEHAVETKLIYRSGA